MNSLREEYIKHIAVTLKAEGLELTRKRKEAVKLLYDLMEHIDAESLWLKLKAKGVAISRASVYNLMQILVQNGFAERSKSGHDRCSSFKAIKIQTEF